ncbi:uncharacterized protein LOC102358994 [Latimeria chalumnae]|uniref:uncharacterized protein LOC102358994 n=1 Tax=Latimeria chalumnae TaxID=7897 RepID=UPI00313D0C45
MFLEIHILENENSTTEAQTDTKKKTVHVAEGHVIEPKTFTPCSANPVQRKNEAVIVKGHQGELEKQELVHIVPRYNEPEKVPQYLVEKVQRNNEVDIVKGHQGGFKKQVKEPIHNLQHHEPERFHQYFEEKRQWNNNDGDIKGHRVKLVMQAKGDQGQAWGRKENLGTGEVHSDLRLSGLQLSSGLSDFGRIGPRLNSNLR